MSKSANAGPAERKLGARFGIKTFHQADIEALFEHAGFSPIYKELKTDGNVSYWFGKDQIEPLAAAGVPERIPLHWWAHHAIVGDPPTID